MVPDHSADVDRSTAEGTAESTATCANTPTITGASRPAGVVSKPANRYGFGVRLLLLTVSALYQDALLMTYLEVGIMGNIWKFFT